MGEHKWSVEQELRMIIAELQTQENRITVFKDKVKILKAIKLIREVLK